MQITHLRLVNFRQHEHTVLQLGAGLTGIVGPNGAGKTTLLEAIAWAMYGMPAARGGKESIKRRGAPPRAPVEVELEFDLGAHHYRLRRTLSTAELFQDHDPAPVANSLGAVTERVTRLLGMTRDEFFNTYFTGQKELAVMAAMSAPERAQFLSRVLGYERLRAAQDLLRDRRATLRATIVGLERSLPAPGALAAERRDAEARVAAAAAAATAAAEGVEGAARILAEVRPRWEAAQRLREEVHALEGERKVAQHQVEVARQRFDDLDRQLAEAAAARDRLAAVQAELAPLAALQEEVAALHAAARAQQAHQQRLGQRRAIAERVAELERRLAGAPAPDAVATVRARLQAARLRLAEVTRTAEERHTAWVRDAQDVDTSLRAYRDQYRELKAQVDRLERLGPEGACPTCGRPLGDGAGTVVELVRGQLDQVAFNGRFYRQRAAQLAARPTELARAERGQARLGRVVEALTERAASLEEQGQIAAAVARDLQQLRARLAELDAAAAGAPAAVDEARLQAAEAEVRRLEPRRLEAERLRVSAERAGRLAEEAVAAEQALSAREQQLRALVERLAATGYSEAAHEEARAALQRAEAAHRAAELAAERAGAEQRAAREALAGVDRREREAADRLAELEAARRDLALAEELDRALNELRADLNATLRPDLSDLASGFLRDLSRGRYTDLELDESYVPTIVDDGEAKQVISGGEEDIANLALRLAISQMIAERAGQPLALLVLDEIFGSLDEERRAAVVDLLRALADRFPQVILITHIESVRDGFDRIVRVAFDPRRRVAEVHDEPVGEPAGVAA